jgi:hypothetical protein
MGTALDEFGVHLADTATAENADTNVGAHDAP